jgi:hypothetical protein
MKQRLMELISPKAAISRIARCWLRLRPHAASMPSKCASASRGLTMWSASRAMLIPPRRWESTACPVSSSAGESPSKARRRPNISRRRSRVPRTNEPSSGRAVSREALVNSNISRRILQVRPLAISVKRTHLCPICSSTPRSPGKMPPTSKLIRQILGAVSEFDKAMVVAKLKGARERKRALTGKKVEGRKSHAEQGQSTLRRGVLLGPSAELGSATLAGDASRPAIHSGVPKRRLCPSTGFVTATTIRFQSLSSLPHHLFMPG